MAGEYVEFHNNAQPALNETNVNLMQQLIKQDIQGAVSGDTLPVGAIMPFGSDTIPENWLLCDGSAVSREDYQQLFNTIGTTFGQGDGFTTFNLPDLRDRVPIGKDTTDTDFNTLGKTAGEREHTLTVQEMPSHKHTERFGNLAWVDTNGTGTSQTGNEATYYGSATARANETTNTGGGQAHNITQPSIATNYIIKAQQSAGVVANVVDNLISTSVTNALSANQGKVLADRMSYSTTEKIIGKWIDGKDRYIKVVDIGNLPNASIKQVAHNIDNLDRVTKLYGIAYNTNTSNQHPLPYASTVNNSLNNIGINIEGNNININTGVDRSEFTGYVIIEYTKSTS